MPLKIDIISECRYCSNFRWKYHPRDRWCFKLKTQIENPFSIPKDCPLEEHDLEKDKRELFDSIEKLKRYAETRKYPATKEEINEVKYLLSNRYMEYLGAMESDGSNGDETKLKYQKYIGAKCIAQLWLTEGEIKDVEGE